MHVSLAPGTVVEILSTEKVNGWYPARYGNAYGYVYSLFLSSLY